MFSANIILPLALAVTPALAGNGALHANPSNTDIGLTPHGSDWLWAVFAVMLLSDLVFVAWSFKAPRGERTFFQIPIMILTTASIAYFCLASNLGQTGIPVEFRAAPGTTRSIWYVRYIDWTITTPLLLLELLLATGLPLSDIVTVCFLDVAMIVVGLAGALVASSYKWGLFTMGCFFEFYIWFVLFGPGRNTAGLLGTNVRKAYTTSAFYLMGIWALYPICWGLAEGSNTISMTGEVVFYGILDILAKPVFCFIHVNALRRIPYETFGLMSGKTSAGAVTGHGAYGDKSRLHDRDAAAATTGSVNTSGTGAHQGVGTGGPGLTANNGVNNGMGHTGTGVGQHTV